ncbi:MAG TPA: winged helix DNA-binding protein [Kofleriaceae bacterium]
MPKKPKSAPRRIVSSAHLADNPVGGLSELEFALSRLVNAYHRWMVRCIELSIRNTSGIGRATLGALDVLVLHHVNSKEIAKRLPDIARTLNIDDIHTVNYALKKLVRIGLVKSERHGKEMFYLTTPRGRGLCDQYRDFRERLLIASLTRLGNPDSAISHAAELLHGLAGIYGQAADVAASQ